jgi:precorrin-2 dehydrogenase/sirohydrochlorin ferrochelatase
VTVLYPAFLDLQGRSCVVVGGGSIATRKIEALLECGADVAVIAPRVTDAVHDAARAGKLSWMSREYRRGDLRSAFLAIAATDSAIVNSTVVADAKADRVLVGSVDSGTGADFASAAVARRGELAVAVSSGGRSPGFARYLRDELETFVDDRVAAYEVVSELRASGDAPNAAALHRAIDPDVTAALARGDRELARGLLRDRLTDERRAVSPSTSGAE